MRLTKAFFYFWSCSFVLASIVYFILSLVMPGGSVFGVLFRMFLYHLEHPYQYIALITFFYSVIVTAYCSYGSLPSGVIMKLYLWLAIVGVTILIASAPGGMLWKIHDMQAGYFPNGSITSDLLWGAKSGIKLGWLILGYSFPYNIIGFISGYFLTMKGILLFGSEKRR